MKKPNPVDSHLLAQADRSLGAAKSNLTRAQDALQFAGALDGGAGPPLVMTPRVKSFRDHLLATNGGNAAIADMTVDHLLRQGAAMQVHAAELRVELVKLDASIAAYHEETRRQLAPLEAEVERLASATTAAVTAFDATRITRESKLNATFGARRNAILSALQSPHRPEYRTEWREPKPGELPNAGMVFPDEH